jgi:hypothetical protein
MASKCLRPGWWRSSDFVKRVDEIQFPHRFVNHLTSQPDGKLQSRHRIFSRGSKNPAAQT